MGIIKKGVELSTNDENVIKEIDNILINKESAINSLNLYTGIIYIIDIMLSFKDIYGHYGYYSILIYSRLNNYKNFYDLFSSPEYLEEYSKKNSIILKDIIDSYTI